ncbi:MAG: SH3 domain-containing protein [Nitrospirota bacterium]
MIDFGALKRWGFILAALVIVIAAGNAAALCVTGQTKMREGPGNHYKARWDIYAFTPVVRVGTSLSGEWYAVRDSDGDVGWVRKRLLTSRYRCAVVTADEVNVRTGPGTRYPLSAAGKAMKYYSYRVVQQKKQWGKLSDEWGNRGWVHRDYLWIQ